MKYIKTFEAKAKVGQKVICIDYRDSQECLIKYDIYEIEFIQATIVGDQYKLVDIPHTWNPSRFKVATAKEVKEFEMNKNVKKYNL